MHSTFAKFLVQHGEHQYLVMFRLDRSIWTGAVSEFKDRAESNKLEFGTCSPPSDKTACELVCQYSKVRKRDK